jgi:MFS family permease
MSERDSNSPIGGPYAHYVLGVLVIVYVFNFIDRNILSILSESIKADLGVTDAQMGFLYGTVFAVFYSVFGIPLARFADVWIRRSLISAGLLFWSAMTALSGTAGSFASLAGYRIGVGVGEASASPAAFSMLSDYYPPRLRATAIAIYSSGVYIGGGIGLFLGGYIMESWNAAYADVGNAPFDLKGWQVAFLAVGIPGIAMAAWVRSLREPVRGISEGLIVEAHPAPFRVLATEVMSVLPILNLAGLRAAGASLGINAIAALCITVVGYGLYLLTDSIAQWVALGIGAYVVFSWAQALAKRDPATFAMIFRSRAMRYTMISFPTMSFIGYGTGFWMPPLMLRLHEGVSAAEVGLYLGLGGALGGFLGVTIGGILADRFKQRHPAGRLILLAVAILSTPPFVLWVMYTDSLTTAYLVNIFASMFGAAATSVPPSTAADLVLPRMRAVAGAYYILLNTTIGLALGPYCMGKISDVFVASGMNDGEALRAAISVSLLILVVSLTFLLLAWRVLPEDEASRLERARALGEPV